ncbi:MAG: serine racemase VanT catalytic subunit [Candidatus Cohnella colombiensis]|uniref:Alanine racemase n=1 Tax=Candidatus Cohnella colombiensis TaxID=3121368 RepID=A0AA95EW37_9BACL|nr:MAG: serine racemase VanT catalytic subunit [Cohnella sp.]
MNPYRGGARNYTRNYAGVDYFRMVAALLVIAIHTGPLTSYSATADFLLTGIVARLAVPFFFIVSGYFLFRNLSGDHTRDWSVVFRFVRRTGWLYLVSILIYVPLNVYAGYFTEKLTVAELVQDLVFDGTFYHLWYLPALMLGVLITYWLKRWCSIKWVLGITVFLYLVGLLGDSYYGLMEQVSVLREGYGVLFSTFEYTRNGLFFAPLFIVLGMSLTKADRYKMTTAISGVTFGALLGFMIIEGIVLRQLHLPRHDSMYIFLVPAVYGLFCLLLGFKGKGRTEHLRSLSTWIYILHPLAIVLVRGVGKVAGLTAIIVENSLVHYLAVVLLTLIGSEAVVRLTSRSKGKTINQDRAWAEINLNHLEHNLMEIKRIVPSNCSVIAVIKADAYGHGAVEIAERLSHAGVRHFAVAEISEGIQLRESGIEGEIVVLGYTSPGRFGELAHYKLTQTMVDAQYGELMSGYGAPLMAHVKIDTGMNRLGEPYECLERIESMYRYRNVQVTGTFSHLATADRHGTEDVAFVELQLERFDKVVKHLLAQGIKPGVLHIQSSYGILNYPELRFDRVRAGIALYGMLCEAGDQVNVDVNLRPVLSLKARVSRVHTIRANTPVGYGFHYVSNQDRQIATLAIGYADGVPRVLSEAERGGCVLLHGQRAHIVGKVCMDQLIVDVTGIADVRQGDVATLIGEDGDASITAGQLAAQCDTITNEILSCIGGRVRKVYV